MLGDLVKHNTEILPRLAEPLVGSGKILPRLSLVGSVQSNLPPMILELIIVAVEHRHHRELMFLTVLLTLLVLPTLSLQTILVLPTLLVQKLTVLVPSLLLEGGKRVYFLLARERTGRGRRRR